jgi:hypothetical protein
LGSRRWRPPLVRRDGDSDFVHLGVTTKLRDFTSERFGVFGNVTYRFATF